MVSNFGSPTRELTRVPYPQAYDTLSYATKDEAQVYYFGPPLNAKDLVAYFKDAGVPVSS
jgi:hypothetical protein